MSRCGFRSVHNFATAPGTGAPGFAEEAGNLGRLRLNEG